MEFGLYIHIPYCLQRCLYCDFATYEVNTTLDPNSYFELLKAEILQRHATIPYRQISSIYFGGGTPSLVDPQLIINLLSELANLGFTFNKKTEVTIEINPGTTFNKNIEKYLESPVNRFSVGAQTFNNQQLQQCGRKHNVKDTIQTLDLLNKNKLNFSLDILYALPHQSSEELKYDLDYALSFKPKHISPYCLTVPKKHTLNKNRPTDQTQVKMFNLIKSTLENNNYCQYEISNFCQKGFESSHNLIYWSDQPYWGIGLSAHSFFPEQRLRFWNPKTMNTYKKLILEEENQFSLTGLDKIQLYQDQYEYLQPHEVMTDYCHTFLRKSSGIAKAALRKKFESHQHEIIVNKLGDLSQNGFIEESPSHWCFTIKGQNLSNIVFEKLCFTNLDISAF